MAKQTRTQNQRKFYLIEEYTEDIRTTGIKRYDVRTCTTESQLREAILKGPQNIGGRLIPTREIRLQLDLILD